MGNQQQDSVIIREDQTTDAELDRILEWLDERYYHSLGITAFIHQTQMFDTKWKLLWLHDVATTDKILAVAVVMEGGTCFYCSENNSKSALLFSRIFELKPNRIGTSLYGRDSLKSFHNQHVQVSRTYEQWIMICNQQFPNSKGRLAKQLDIKRLEEYQHLYNQERNVNEKPDWNTLITQGKIVVNEFNGQIVSIVRFGIETKRLVSIGGTYTFPEYRRLGYAEKVLEFAVECVVQRGLIAHLIVDTDNIAAISLYRGMGFETVGSCQVTYMTYL